MVRSGPEVPISRRYRARAGRWEAPAACRSRSRSARRSGLRGANRSAGPSRPPHPNRPPHRNQNRPKAWSQPTYRSSPSHFQHQGRLVKADHRNRPPHLNLPRFWGRRRRWSRRRPPNQPRCPNRPAKLHHPKPPANPNRPARPRLRDAADSCSTRSPPPALSSLRRWPITGVCCPELVPVPAPARRRSVVRPIARNCCLRWISRRSCTSAMQLTRRRRPQSYQACRTQPLDQPGRRHLPKSRSPRRLRVPAAGLQPLPGEDDIDKGLDRDTSDCHRGHPRCPFGPNARGRSDERASARRGVDLVQRAGAGRLRLHGEQPDAAGLSASSYPVRRGATCAAVSA